MRPRDGAGRLTRKTFCMEALNEGWDDVEAMSEGSYTAPGQRSVWRRTDPEFAAACAACERDDDLRVVEAARQRALAGDSRALTLCFRATRGLARPAPADSRRPAHEPKPLPPAVAGAMIEAGLRALGEDLPVLPERRPPVNQRPAAFPPTQAAGPPAMAEAARMARRRFP
jgi:hypothetical protein